MNSIQNDFINTGEYSNKFDEFGNLILLENSDVYLSVPFSNEVFDIKSLSDIYNFEFEEFKDIKQVSDSKISSFESERDQLLKRIADLTTQLSQSDSSQKDSLLAANKNIIIELRIQAGQGNSPLDFNSAFPYLPNKIK